MFDVTGTFLDELQQWFAKNCPDTETFILEIENSQGDGVPIAERGNIKAIGHLERIKAEADGAIIARVELCARLPQAVAGTRWLGRDYGVPASASPSTAHSLKLTQQTAPGPAACPISARSTRHRTVVALTGARAPCATSKARLIR